MTDKIESRTFPKGSALAAGHATGGYLGTTTALATTRAKPSQVFFTPNLNSDGLLRVYSKINATIGGKVAIKLHTGEPHGPNILPREMVRALQQHIPNSCLVETNTLYKGERNTTAEHRETLKINGWDFCPVDIMDEEAL